MFSDTATGLINDTPGRSGAQPAEPRADPARAGRRRTRSGHRARLRCRRSRYTQNFIDRAVRGDYMNLFVIFDLTVPRLKRGLFLGTRWGQDGAPLVPAPGDPWYSVHADYTQGSRWRRRRRRRRRAPLVAPPLVARTPSTAPPPVAGQQPHGEVVADADPFRPKPVDHLHDRVGHRCRWSWSFVLHAGAHPAGYRADHRDAGAAGHGRPVPVRQRDVSRRADRQGHRGGRATRDGAEATLSLDTSPKIPADLQAEVRSVSAVGEQYVDLLPRTDSRAVPAGRLGDRRWTTPRSRSRSARCWISSAR